MTIYIGVDPGVHGGCVALDDKGKAIAATPMPIVGPAKARRFNARALDEWLNDLLGDRMACLEQPIPMPGLPSNNMLAMGVLYGGLLTIFELKGIPLIEIRPQTWQGIIDGLPGRPDTKELGDAIKAMGTPKTIEDRARLNELKKRKASALHLHRKNLKATVGVKALQVAPELRAMGTNGKLPDWLSDSFWVARYGRTRATGSR